MRPVDIEETEWLDATFNESCGVFDNDYEKERWKNHFKTLFEYRDIRSKELTTFFLNCVLNKVHSWISANENRHNPILICVVKDDLYRIKEFCNYYRELGIIHFVFIDNNSSDGTKEYLCSQNDCDVFICEDEYSSAKRVAWINRIVSIYGENRWYIVVDSDEFIRYIGMERMDIPELIERAEKNGANRIQGFLLDMYAKEGLFASGEEKSFLNNMRFFDKNTYTIHNSENGPHITGGPRKRVLKTNATLEKCPIIFISDNDIIASAHYSLPIKKAKESPILLSICHYKFLDKNDLSKIYEAVETEKYAGGSAEYKKYLFQYKKGNMNTFYDGAISEEYIDSSSLSILYDRFGI